MEHEVLASANKEQKMDGNKKIINIARRWSEGNGRKPSKM